MNGDKGLHYHALSEYFPMLNFVDRKKLKESIAQIGLLEPIMLYEGMILDGRNRYEVCIELNIEPRFVEITENAFAIAIASNLARRHMSGVQRAGVLRKLYPPKASGGDTTAPAGAPAGALDELPPEGTELTSGQVADLVGLTVGPDGTNSQVRDFDYVKRKNEAKADAVVEGRISLSEALHEVRPQVTVSEPKVITPMGVGMDAIKALKGAWTMLDDSNKSEGDKVAILNRWWLMLHEVILQWDTLAHFEETDDDE